MTVRNGSSFLDNFQCQSFNLSHDNVLKRCSWFALYLHMLLEMTSGPNVMLELDKEYVQKKETFQYPILSHSVVRR